MRPRFSCPDDVRRRTWCLGVDISSPITRFRKCAAGVSVSRRHICSHLSSWDIELPMRRSGKCASVVFMFRCHAWSHLLSKCIGSTMNRAGKYAPRDFGSRRHTRPYLLSRHIRSPGWGWVIALLEFLHIDVISSRTCRHGVWGCRRLGLEGAFLKFSSQAGTFSRICTAFRYTPCELFRSALPVSRHRRPYTPRH